MDAAYNIALYQLLAQWNPMQLSDTLGDQEIYDCMDVIHQKLPQQETVKKIQEIYEFNFEEQLNEADIIQILEQAEKINQTCQL